MRNFFRKLRQSRFSYEPLVVVRIFKDRLLHNLDIFQKAVPQWGLAPVLKANAYGHGLVEVAHAIAEHPAISFLVVDSYYEALILRNEKITTPILVIGYSLQDNVTHSRLKDVAFTITSLAQLHTFAQTLITPHTFHLKFDTGMHRQGIMPEEFDEVVALVQASPHIHVTGICSHLADADSGDGSFTKKQITVWNGVVARWRTLFPNTAYYHLSATAGVRFAKDIDANVGRLGIGLYGILDVVKNLQPVFRMETVVAGVRTIQAGESVGYNTTWTVKAPTTVATIPVGYYEGVDRRLSNKGSVQVNGVMCPIVGRVSMNMTTVDATGVPQVKEGDRVVVVSENTNDTNTIQNMAQLCDTIPYTLLVHIPATLRRVIEG